jgi:hypothetical protein
VSRKRLLASASRTSRLRTSRWPPSVGRVPLWQRAPHTPPLHPPPPPRDRAHRPVAGAGGIRPAYTGGACTRGGCYVTVNTVPVKYSAPPLPPTLVAALRWPRRSLGASSRAWGGRTAPHDRGADDPQQLTTGPLHGQESDCSLRHLHGRCLRAAVGARPPHEPDELAADAGRVRNPAARDAGRLPRSSWPAPALLSAATSEPSVHPSPSLWRLSPVSLSAHSAVQRCKCCES